MKQLVESVQKRLGDLVDPETGLTFSEMRLIKRVTETEPGVVKVDFSPTSPICPIALQLAIEIKKAALEIENVRNALVYCRGHMMEQKINDLINSGGPDV
jgi:metal-sulfur cluster biosynthetic enzyme